MQEDVIHASADGQSSKPGARPSKPVIRRSTFGTQKGVSAMTLIANHAAINARVIGANEHESHYIFDLLMRAIRQTSFRMCSRKADTHG
ncbi:Tn3 family transposase [Enterobacter cloacae]|uniref:Tn3 family transposase n=1 Tax=Enterobacter cloacae TaxID=550 RepID=UPI00388D2AD9